LVKVEVGLKHWRPVRETGPKLGLEKQHFGGLPDIFAAAAAAAAAAVSAAVVSAVMGKVAGKVTVVVYLLGWTRAKSRRVGVCSARDDVMSGIFYAGLGWATGKREGLYVMLMCLLGTGATVCVSLALI